MSDSEWDYILAALQWKFGYLIGLAAWQTLIRLVMVFLNAQFKQFMESAIPEDAAWARKLFHHRFYRITGFIINACLSVKLPTAARGAGGTALLAKPPVPAPEKPKDS